jgi:methionine synthase I (cobalamin-dependent)/5,10-methylenetetrahydrofolate reductase
MTPRERFRLRLAQSPLLADGAMGTLLFSRGVPQRACLDELATTRPDLIGAIHREYIGAGADLIETATFGANRRRLEAFGLAGHAHRLNRRAAQVAREARDVSGRDVLVAGSLGPLGSPATELVEPAALIRSMVREQVDGLLEGGADLLVFETFGDLAQLLLAVEEARRASDLPILAEMTFGEELVAADGTTPRQAAVALLAAGVDAFGVNCGAGPFACLEALVQMHAAGVPAEAGAEVAGSALSIMPNAGLPRRVEGQFVYAAGPGYFGDLAAQAYAAGARIVGGCCGTTPEHVAAMRASLDARAHEERLVAATRLPRATEPVWTVAAPVTDPAGEGDAPTPSRLAQSLAAGRFVVSVEIDPPRSIRIDRTVAAARLLRDAGVDLVNVSDSAMARVRMGCLAVSFAIQHDVDLECLVHFTTRDRNLMALESELLGAHALGIRNVLALTGDPPRLGDYPAASAVWDVDSIGLVGILDRLNRGEDAAGSPIGRRASFTIACALDPTAADQTTEWDRLERKLAAGAHLVMTQPLYAAEQVDEMLAEARRRFGPAGIPVPVLLGVLPLQSSRHAEFLHHEVPGITIPAAARAAMAAAGDGAGEVGLDMATALVEATCDRVAGIYVMPSFGRYEQAAELVRRVRALRPASMGGATRPQQEGIG